jgi:predicted nucleotidyltransferase
LVLPVALEQKDWQTDWGTFQIELPGYKTQIIKILKLRKSHMNELDEKTKQKIIAVILALMPDVKIYLFGSRARGTNRPMADIDIALDGGKELSRADVDEIKSMFKESNIMYVIDVVDFHSITELMQQQILKDRVIWKA